MSAPRGLAGEAGPVAPFQIEIEPDPGDFDELGHVNNAVYLRWVQDVATRHWLSSAPPGDSETIAWVVRRHEIDYLSPAVPRDRLVARTWVGAAEGILFERLTEIARTSDGAVLARARTLWCPIDAGTGKPRRVGARVRALFSTSSPRTLTDP